MFNYFRTINAGKSKRNEDQSAIHSGILTRCVTRSIQIPDDSPSGSNNKQSDSGCRNIDNSLHAQKVQKQQYMVSLPYYFFGVFDGHAGWGAAVASANQLHQVIHVRFTIQQLIMLLNSIIQIYEYFFIISGKVI